MLEDGGMVAPAAQVQPSPGPLLGANPSLPGFVYFLPSRLKLDVLPLTLYSSRLQIILNTTTGWAFYLGECMQNRYR